jgi:putative ABC transport system permease protein
MRGSSRQKTWKLFEALLPAGLDLVPIAARDAAARELAQAFRINLTAMSLLALLIAAFLIYNTQTFSVLRRLEVLGDLRLLGVSRSRSMRWCCSRPCWSA